MLDQAQIPLRRLDKSRAHNFKYQPDANEMNRLAEIGGWRKLKDIVIRGQLIPQDWGWLLDAHLEGCVVLSCVISNAPINFPLKVKIQREYHKELPEMPEDFSWEIDSNVEQEEIPQSLDLNALILESVSLEIPDYPRLPKYETGAYSDEKWQYSTQNQDEEDMRKPFAGLKNMLDDKNGK